MLAKIQSGGVYGVEAFAVEIEVDAGGGEFKTVMVGLPDAAVKESCDRVITALKNSGLGFPDGRVTINLAPAEKRKEGPRFDLPIALGICTANKVLPKEALSGVMAIGELALSGRVRPVRGVLPVARMAREMGVERLLVPTDNGLEAAVVEGLEVFPVDTLEEAVQFLSGELAFDALQVDTDALFREQQASPIDFADVKGQESAKRAIEISVAGGHNLLMLGPPGTGKSMIAKRVATILPPLTLDEALEVTQIHSIAGTLPSRQALIGQRPFRAPHHTVSDAGLLGGGTHPMPGEVSLAHHGVLFLDELPEFARHVLEVMRQPLEDGQVTIARAAASVTFPSRMMLVAAMNPCPCGFLGHPTTACRCTSTQVGRYRGRISGPLLDRIDIHVEVPAMDVNRLAGLPDGESSEAIRERVISARERQQARYDAQDHVHCNADMGSRDVARHCVLDDLGQGMLKQAVTELSLSARAYDRILKVARTIADLDGDESIQSHHIGEAVQYRTLDRGH